MGNDEVHFTRWVFLSVICLFDGMVVLMSFRCEVCNKPAPAGTSCNKKVSRIRHRVYSEREYAKRTIVYEKGKKKKKWIPDPGGVGWEIVSEVRCCPSCASKFPEPKMV